LCIFAIVNPLTLDRGVDSLIEAISGMCAGIIHVGSSNRIEGRTPGQLEMNVSLRYSSLKTRSKQNLNLAISNSAYGKYLSQTRSL